MTWVLVLVVCSALSDPSTCEDRVLAHRLGEAECLALARPLSARGDIAECLREEHDVIEEPEEQNAPAERTITGPTASDGDRQAHGQSARPGAH
jgi:hypothetical protein